MKSEIFCKKFVVKDYYGREPCVFLGIVLGEDDNFIFIRTARGKHTFNKSQILSIQSTAERFRGYHNGSS
jgi:hypothetical protein